MSWRYRRYNSYSRAFKPRFFFSEKEIDFTSEFLDYKQFLLQEFFSVDRETKKKIAKYYTDKYGMRAFSYLERKNSEWLNGNYHLTELMQERILTLMPNFLSREAKHKLGIHEFMASIKHMVKAFERDQNSRYRSKKTINRPEELIQIFDFEYQKINQLNTYKHKYNVLTDDEKLEAIEISKYILERKLQNYFDQIERDSKTYTPFISKFSRGIFTATYNIKVFNSVVEISKINMFEIEFPKFEVLDTEASSRFKYYSDKYLAHELVQMYNKSQEAVQNSFLNEDDLETFHSYYSETIKGNNEVEMKATFEGEGGTLELKYKFLPKKTLVSSIVTSFSKLIIYILVIVVLLSLSFFEKIISLFVLLGFLFGVVMISFAKGELDNLLSKIDELKKHGKQ